AVKIRYGDSDKRSPHISIHSRDLTQPEVYSFLIQVRPCPRPGNHHRELALAHEIFGIAVRTTLWQDPGLDQRNDFRQCRDDPGSGDANVPEVIFVAFPPEDVAAAAGQDSPAVVGASRVPKDRDYAGVLPFYVPVDRRQL